jgi:hypothetical protein
LWNENLAFYKKLVTKYKWQQEPVIELIQYFDKVGICEKYFPRNSHKSLGLSTADNYEQRLELPMEQQSPSYSLYPAVPGSV